MKPNLKFLQKVAAGMVRIERTYSPRTGSNTNFVGGEAAAKKHADAGYIKLPYGPRAMLGAPDLATLTELGRKALGG